MTNQPTQVSPRLHLDFLDGLRGFAALYVALSHTALLLSLETKQVPHWASLALRPLAFGHYAVAIFIVLSGYCLMLPVALAADKHLRGGWREYLLRRSRRILPPYYAALILSVLTMPLVTLVKRRAGVPLTESDFLTPGNVLSHLLLVHNWSYVYFQSIDGPLWSVATEWQIYFFLPFLLLPLWRRGGLAVTVAAAFGIGLAPHFWCSVRDNFDWACPWYLGLFACGMAGAVISAGRDPKLQPLLEKAPWGLLTVVCAAAVGVGHFLGHFLPLGASRAGSDSSQWYMDILCGLFSVCLLILCSRRAGAGKFWLTDFLQSSPAMMLGAMSYSLYLVHLPLEQGMIWLLCSRHLAFFPLLATTFLLVVPVVVSLCYLFHRAFERPFMPGRPRSEKAAEKASLLSPAP